jgi:hypothetical protein
MLEQAPRLQNNPLAHALPHAPQFAGSDCEFVQLVPHRVSGALH